MDLTDCKVHDLRHTFGFRLRAAGVSYDDRKDLLGHNSNRITDHYYLADVESLIHALKQMEEWDLQQKSRQSPPEPNITYFTESV